MMTSRSKVELKCPNCKRKFEHRIPAGVGSLNVLCMRCDSKVAELHTDGIETEIIFEGDE